MVELWLGWYFSGVGLGVVKADVVWCHRMCFGSHGVINFGVKLLIFVAVSLVEYGFVYIGLVVVLLGYFKWESLI